MGLRLAEGIDPDRFTRACRLPLDPNGFRFSRDDGLVETTANGRLRVTRRGFPVLDAVVADLAA